MSLMPDTFRDLLELFALVSAVCLAALLGRAGQILGLMWLDRRSEARRPAVVPLIAADTPAPGPVKSGRSPFAPKQREAAK